MFHAEVADMFSIMIQEYFYDAHQKFASLNLVYSSFSTSYCTGSYFCIDACVFGEKHNLG